MIEGVFKILRNPGLEVGRGGRRAEVQEQRVPGAVLGGAVWIRVATLNIGREGDAGIVEPALVLLDDENLHARSIIGNCPVRSVRIDCELDPHALCQVTHRHLVVEPLGTVRVPPVGGGVFQCDKRGRELGVASRLGAEGDMHVNARSRLRRLLLVDVMKRGECRIPSVFWHGEAQHGVKVPFRVEIHFIHFERFAGFDKRWVIQYLPRHVHLEVLVIPVFPAGQLVTRYRRSGLEGGPGKRKERGCIVVGPYAVWVGVGTALAHLAQGLARVIDSTRRSR